MQVYSKPFYIIYGTPQNQALRYAMRDLAVYIANSHMAAHNTHVRVLSDLDYRSGGFSRDPELANILVIGGPTINKFMKKTCHGISYVVSNGNNIENVERNDAYQQQQQSLRDKNELLCRSPAIFEVDAGSDVTDAQIKRFRIGPYTFDQPDDAAIFTFPLARRELAKRRKNGINIPSASLSGSIDVNGAFNKNSPNDHSKSSTSNDDGIDDEWSVGLGACLHASTPEGFMHLSRIAWPVIPPMVCPMPDA